MKLRNLTVSVSPASVFALAMLASLSCGGDGSGTNGQDGQQGLQGPPGPPGMDGKDATSADKVGTRLKRYSSVTVAEDGTQSATPSYVYRDTKLSIDCSFQPSIDGKQRCLPIYGAADVVSVAAQASYFWDAGCTQKAYSALKPCTRPKYLLLYSSTTASCPAASQYAVYTAPAEVTPTALYSGSSPASCYALSKASIDSFLMSFVLYDLSGKSPISPTEFVGATTTQQLLP